MGKCLSWLQERIRHWIKPATPTLIYGLLSDLPRSRTDLLVENAYLRQQLIVLGEYPLSTRTEALKKVLQCNSQKF